MRILFICSFLCISTLSLSAQVSIGFKGGVNLAKWTNIDNYVDVYNDILVDEFLVGVNVGIVTEVNLYQELYVQAEVNFTHKGHHPKQLVGTHIYNTYAHFDLYVLELAFLPKYKYSWDSFGVFAFAGPSVGYYINCTKTKFSSRNGEVNETGRNYLALDTDLFNRWEFSLYLGGGIFIPIKDSMEVFFDARYLVGLTDVNNEAILQAFHLRGEELAHRNRGIGLTLGALFDL
ncbi:MAG: porin family protein [Bacteroidota bacterium]